MDSSSSPTIISTRHRGAEAVLHGTTLAEAQPELEQLAARPSPKGRGQVLRHPKDAVLDALVEAQDEAHAQRIIAALEATGFKASREISGVE